VESKPVAIRYLTVEMCKVKLKATKHHSVRRIGGVEL